MLFCAIAIIVAVVMLKKNQNVTNPENNADATQTPTLLKTSVAPAQTSASAATTVVPDDALIYKNTDYGFQITFNNVWKGYAVKPVGVGNTRSKAALSIYLPSESKSPLTIYVFEKNVWSSIDKNTLSSTKVAENASYVFSYSTWESPPANLVTITDKEIANIINSFTIIQK